jgi:peptide/nickel transport system substrate-binding protein
LRAVETGRADLLGGTLLSGLPPADLDVLASLYAGQLHRNVQPLTFMLTMNTKIPPFDRLGARRALNYAIDRRASVAVQGGGLLARATCQILPPSFPGYRPYCPYSTGSGAFGAPDIARARRMVERSGTKGMHVRIVGPYRGPFARQARLARTALAQIGYRPMLRRLPVDRMFEYAQDRRNRVNLWPVFWLADFPSADNYIGGVFPCAADRTVCDGATRRLIAAARRLQQTGGSADPVWARVDRRLTDRAAVVALTNVRWADVVSPRLGNYQYNPQHGLLLDQAWVR